METATTPRRRTLSPGPAPARGILALVAAAALGACRDAPTDPLVGLVAQEAYAALAVGVSFPDPGAWRASGWLEEEGAQALEAWRDSWDLPAAEGGEAREGTYPILAASVARGAERGALDAELALLAEGVTRAEALVAEGSPAHVVTGIQIARAEHEAAASALAAGDPLAAVTALLRGGDALREVGPEAVARSLQSQAEAGLGSIPDPHPYSEQELERLRRLVRGGRQALEEGDWVLAIRRAFYAKALLKGNG